MSHMLPRPPPSLSSTTDSSTLSALFDFDHMVKDSKQVWRVTSNKKTPKTIRTSFLIKGRESETTNKIEKDESLRRASFTSQVALEHLQDFMSYAYTFYTRLLENETTFEDFKTGWLEALRDIARYRMPVAAIIVTGYSSRSSSSLSS
ncbi:hypothetical protein JOM56_003119 [Amanita muscaria]